MVVLEPIPIIKSLKDSVSYVSIEIIYREKETLRRYMETYGMILLQDELKTIKKQKKDSCWSKIYLREEDIVVMTHFGSHHILI